MFHDTHHKKKSEQSIFTCPSACVTSWIVQVVGWWQSIGGELVSTSSDATNHDKIWGGVKPPSQVQRQIFPNLRKRNLSPVVHEEALPWCTSNLSLHEQYDRCTRSLCADTAQTLNLDTSYKTDLFVIFV